MLLQSVGHFQHVARPHVLQQQRQRQAVGRREAIGLLLDAADVVQGRAVKDRAGAVDFDPVKGDILGARLEGHASLGLVLHPLDRLQADGGVDEGLVLFRVDLFAQKQITHVAGLFRPEIHPKRTRQNPIRHRS